jgi:hypothetical protein
MLKNALGNPLGKGKIGTRVEKSTPCRDHLGIVTVVAALLREKEIVVALLGSVIGVTEGAFCRSAFRNGERIFTFRTNEFQNLLRFGLNL